MPRVQTKCFGELDYPQDAVYEFPYGLPGFEREHFFVFLERPGTYPLMFMQSLAARDLCFILLPVLAAAPGYQLCLAEEDLEALQLPTDRQPQIGTEVLCAVLVCAGAGDRPPTVNLQSPVVLNLKLRIGLQSIQAQTSYSHRHPLLGRAHPEECATCS